MWNKLKSKRISSPIATFVCRRWWTESLCQSKQTLQTLTRQLHREAQSCKKHSYSYLQNLDARHFQGLSLSRKKGVRDRRKMELTILGKKSLSPRQDVYIFMVTKRSWADVGLWVGAWLLPETSCPRPTGTFARLTQPQAVSQSIAFSSHSDQWKIWTSFFFFTFSKVFFLI